MSFSLRTLLGMVTLLCVLAWLLTAAPPLVAAIGLFVYVTLQTTFFVTSAVYAGENLKAFCRGALLPALFDYIFVTWVFVQILLSLDLVDFARVWNGESGIEPGVTLLRRTTVIATVLCMLMGLATLGFKRLVEPRRPPPAAAEP